MDLTAALWITVTVIALVFAADAFIVRFIRPSKLSANTRNSTLWFGTLMLLFALACGGVSLYEVLS